MVITFPSDTVDIIDQIRDAIGRNVNFVSHIVSACPTCSLDPITNTSTDSWCPTCSGTYWIATYSGTLVKAHVTWGPADILNWYSAGQQMDGDVRIQIKLTVANLAMVDACDWIQVDDHCVEIKKRILRGVQPLNRILLDCIELEKEPIDFIALTPVPPVPTPPAPVNLILNGTFDSDLNNWSPTINVSWNGFGRTTGSAFVLMNFGDYITQDIIIPVGCTLLTVSLWAYGNAGDNPIYQIGGDSVNLDVGVGGLWVYNTHVFAVAPGVVTLEIGWADVFAGSWYVDDIEAYAS